MKSNQIQYAEMSTTTIRFAEVRVTISDPRVKNTQTFAMGLSEHELNDLSEAQRLRELMYLQDLRDTPLFLHDIDLASKRKKEIIDVIAKKIAWCLADTLGKEK